LIGGLGFSQNTTNFDVSRKFDKLNVAFGAEYRNENLKQGQPESYNTYDINVVTNTPNIKVSSFYYTGSKWNLPRSISSFPRFQACECCLIKKE
jgi:hypothetical protein